MHWNRSPDHIIAAWQDDAEYSLEATSKPVIELGVSDMPIADTPSLLAVQRWCGQRVDVSTPIIAGGGIGPLWLAAMLRAVPRLSPSAAPEPATLYTGATEAEYLASVAMLHTAVDSTLPDAPRRAAIPASYFTPGRQPGISVSWDSLPFLATVDPRPPAARAGAPAEEDAPGDAPPGDPVQDWLAWTALLLALFLILFAVLV